MDSLLRIGIILGSTREGRFSEYPAKWMLALTQNNPASTIELIDLRDYNLPFLTDSVNPSKKNGVYEHSEVARFAEKIKSCDGFIIVTPEYNHAYPAVLKNAIDHIKNEWAKKPLSIVAYGTLGGGRVAEQLKLVMLDMSSVITKHHLHIIAPWNLCNEDGSLKEGALDTYQESFTRLLEEHLWWARLLKENR